MPSLRDQLAPRWSDFLESLRGQWWAHLLIAGALTVVFGGIARAWPAPALIFLLNVVLSLSIGTVTTLVYVFVWGTVLIPGGPLRRALSHGVSIAVGVVGGTELALQLFEFMGYLGLSFSIERTGIWQVGGVVTLVAMMISVVYDRLREQARTVEQREQQAQQALLRAQVDSLQARVNPHFLFNALNTVASLVEDDPDRAIEAIERLSTLLRYSLEGARQGVVPLRRELDSARDYLAIEQLRFGDRLRAQIEVAPGAESHPVPPFILQPLVENAVKHGIARRRAGGRLQIQIEAADELLHVAVYNDGDAEAAEPGTRLGHENLRQRLQLLYGDAAQLQAGPVEGGYRVTMALPGGVEEASPS